MELILYNKAKLAIAEAVAIDEIKDIRDKAEAMRMYAKQSKDFEMANQAAEIRIRAERRLGEMLRQQKETGGMNTGSKGQLKGSDSSGAPTLQVPDKQPPTLSDLGISHNMSSRAQAIANVPEEEFEEVIAEHREQAKELTSATFRKLVANERREEKIETIQANNTAMDTDKKYSVIYADPPWRYEHTKTDSRKIENQYPTMELQDICDLPVFDITSADCVLFLWATSPKLLEALQVLKSWGFTYRTCAVWDKQKIGMGYYFRQQHELLLIGTKGSLPTPEPANRPSSVVSIPRTKHSSKPHEFYDIITKMYPDFEKIELFSRTPQENWAVWGNQA